MSKPSSHRSTRFTQAAKNERSRLSQKRTKLSKRREDLQEKLDALDAELEAVDQEIVVLDGLTSGGRAGATLELASGSERTDVLKGAAIRELAVPLLMQMQGSAPIHYRAWLGLLEDQGYQVAGKRPDAVFLAQVARSPLVRASTQSGYYQLDPNAPDQLRKRLQHQQADLGRLLAEVPNDTDAIARHRQQQRDLKAAIAKTERELDEAMKAVAAFSVPELPEVRVRHAA
jgi:hypothetical protein